jgi:hypothetical protein
VQPGGEDARGGVSGWIRSRPPSMGEGRSPAASTTNRTRRRPAFRRNAPADHVGWLLGGESEAAVVPVEEDPAASRRCGTEIDARVGTPEHLDSRPPAAGRVGAGEAPAGRQRAPTRRIQHATAAPATQRPIGRRALPVGTPRAAAARRRRGGEQVRRSVSSRNAPRSCAADLGRFGGRQPGCATGRAIPVGVPTSRVVRIDRDRDAGAVQQAERVGVPALHDAGRGARRAALGECAAAPGAHHDPGAYA